MWQNLTGGITLYFHLASVLLLFCSRTSNFSTSFCLLADSLLGTLKTFFAAWEKSQEKVLWMRMECWRVRNTGFIWKILWYICENSHLFFLNPKLRFNQILLLQSLQKSSCTSPWYTNTLLFPSVTPWQVSQTAHKLLEPQKQFRKDLWIFLHKQSTTIPLSVPWWVLAPTEITSKTHAELKGTRIKGQQKETCPTWAKVEENNCSIFSHSF